MLPEYGTDIHRVNWKEKIRFISLTIRRRKATLTPEVQACALSLRTLGGRWECLILENHLLIYICLGRQIGKAVGLIFRIAIGQKFNKYPILFLYYIDK